MRDYGTAAVRIGGVSFTYPGSGEAVLNEASLSLERGSFTALIGGNGSGKSTLCKLFNGLIPHFYTGDFSGEVEVLGQSAIGRGVAELSRGIGYVYQDFDNQLVRPTVLDEACFAPLNYGLADYLGRGRRALELCGLERLHSRYIWELSGGQKHLLALAGAMSMEPQILIVDEPVSQLDPRHAERIYEVLRQMNETCGTTVIVIEHHAEFIAKYCKDVALMDSGRIVWHLPVKHALNRITDLNRLGLQPPEVTRAAREAAVRLRPELIREGALLPVTVPEAVDFFKGGFAVSGNGAESLGMSHPSGNTPGLLSGNISRLSGNMTGLSGNAPNPSGNASSLSGNVPSPSGNTPRLSGVASPPPVPAVEFRDARLSYRGIGKSEREVLRGITLSLYENERIALVGNNGAGKSSLLKLIACIVKPQSGSVVVRGKDTLRRSPEQLAGEAVYVYQNPEEMFIEDSVRKEVAYYFTARRMKNADAEIDGVLKHFRLEDLRDRDARLLSGGQQRRVSLAIGCAIKPALLLLDEPTANLDLATRDELVGVLRDLQEFVRTAVIATHDMHLAATWASRVVVLHDGRIAADGTPEEVFADKALLNLAGLTPTPMMELSLELGICPMCLTAEEFAGRLPGLADRKEQMRNAACAPMV